MDWLNQSLLLKVQIDKPISEEALIAPHSLVKSQNPSDYKIPLYEEYPIISGNPFLIESHQNLQNTSQVRSPSPKPNYQPAQYSFLGQSSVLKDSL